MKRKKRFVVIIEDQYSQNGDEDALNIGEVASYFTKEGGIKVLGVVEIPPEVQ